MQSLPIDFPAGTAPGHHPQETGGRLINAFVSEGAFGSRSDRVYRRVPGLTELFTVGDGEFRGAIRVGSVLYVIVDDKAYTVAGSGFTVTQLTGTVPGEGRVTMARNQAATPDILAVHSSGMVKLTDVAVSDFSDPDLPSPSTITAMDGYFFVTSDDGKVFSSGVNTDGFAGTDFVTAESESDGLRRAVPTANSLLFMGESTIEFWQNTGNPEGFPFSRGPVLRTGLKSTHAVAGFEPEWTGPVIWVGNDDVVYLLAGYQPTRISSRQLERLIAKASDLEASVYSVDGHSCWVLTSDSWTWVYDTTTGEWHERTSHQSNRWRCAFGVNAFDGWLAFDRDGQSVFKVDGASHTEHGNPLVFELRSNVMHSFPGRVNIKRAGFDFITGVGLDVAGTVQEREPQVSISWSDDGGRTFGNPVLRDLGTQGEIRRIDVFRTGLAARTGRQWKLSVSDPVPISLLGGAVEFEVHGP